MNKYIKLFIAGILIALSTYCFIGKEYGWGVFCVVISISPVFLFFRNEFLLLTFFRLQRQDMQGAEKWLKYIRKPQAQLVKAQQAYFFYLKGLTKIQQQEKGAIKESETYFKKALSLGLKQSHDIAAVKLNLAMAALSRTQKREAEILLAEAKKYDTKGLLTDQIKMLNEQLKKVNVGRNLHNPQMRHRGKFF